MQNQANHLTNLKKYLSVDICGLFFSVLGFPFFYFFANIEKE